MNSTKPCTPNLDLYLANFNPALHLFKEPVIRFLLQAKWLFLYEMQHWAEISRITMWKIALSMAIEIAALSSNLV